MKTEKQVKEIAKRFYTFCNKYINKFQTTKLELIPGLEIAIVYNHYINDRDIEIHDVKVTKMSKEIKAFAKAIDLDIEHHLLNVYDIENVAAYLNIDDIADQYNDLLNELNEALYDGDDSMYDDYMSDYTEGSLTDFYDAVLEAFNDYKEKAEEKAKEVKMKLTDEYFAIINKPHGRIHVGCQRIPIEKVRELVKLYDEA